MRVPSGMSLLSWLLVVGWLPMLVGVRRAGFAARERPADRDPGPARGLGFPGRRWDLLDVTLLLLTWLAGAGLTFFAVRSVRLVPHPWRAWSGVVLFLAGVATWTRVRLAHGADYAQLPRVPRDLVTRGPYRVVRHPLYLATVCAGLGQLVAGASLECLVFWLLLVASFVVRSVREERLLEAAFGTRWEDYARAVPAAFPTSRRH